MSYRPFSNALANQRNDVEASSRDDFHNDYPARNDRNSSASWRMTTNPSFDAAPHSHFQQDANQVIDATSGEQLDQKPSQVPTDRIVVKKYVTRATLAVYIVLCIEIMIEAFGGTHLGDVDGNQTHIKIVTVAGIELGAHFLTLVALMVAMHETLYLRLSLYDLWIRENGLFLLMWMLSGAMIIAVRGVRAAYAFGAGGGPFNQYEEWSKPAVLPLYYVQRIISMAYYIVTALSVEEGMRGYLYSRACLEKMRV